jgi:hypothetical protein
MHKSLSAIGMAGILLITCSTAVTAQAGTSVLLGNAGWEAFADSTTLGSFAWAGEDESFVKTISLLGTPRQAVAYDEEVVNAELLTGLPAPEPPALVLAGMAFGGVLCGRSLILRRRKVGGATATDEQE